jgi:Flp pilus assembly protein TadD
VPHEGAAASASGEVPPRWSPRSPVFVGLCSVVLGVPLLVLPGAAGPYDDPKAWALPILVAATALVWLAQVRQRSDSPSLAGGQAGRIFCWVVVAYLAWWAVTTAASIAPGQSVLGNFGRGMGLLSVASGVTLFFLVRSECRTRQAAYALIDTALLGSVPVCLLALGQAVGWDLLPKAWDPAVAGLKVRSTFGQHIFLGSYLAVLVPLAVARLGAALSRRQARRGVETDGPVSPLALLPGALWVAGAVGLVAVGAHWPIAWWLLGPWGVAGAVALAAQPAAGGPPGGFRVALQGMLLALQVAVMVLSRARGPFLGLLVGLAVATFVLLGRRRAWKGLAVSLTAAALIVIALLLVNLPHSPLAPLLNGTVFGRLTQVSDVKPGSPVWFRLRVWNGIAAGWAYQLRGREVIPGTSPLARSVLGFGLETQMLTLGQLAVPALGGARARAPDWQAQYLVDRAHNTLLDSLVTGGLVGAGLWVLLVGCLLVVAASRICTSASQEEASFRGWAFGAVVAHLAEGQVGIVTPMPFALFFITAALLVSARWLPFPADEAVRRSPPRWRWSTGVQVAALLIALMTWVSTRWLLASEAYAAGVRHVIAGRMADARADFERSAALCPFLPLPAQALAYASLRMAAGERNAEKRLSLLREGETALVNARGYATGGPMSWVLTAQLALARASAGARDQFAVSLTAFEAAARFRPDDPELLAQWGWALLESGDPARAREAAEKALALSAERQWLAWAVLARAARQQGDAPEARRAADRTRALAPPEARRIIETILP